MNVTDIDADKPDQATKAAARSSTHGSTDDSADGTKDGSKDGLKDGLKDGVPAISDVRSLDRAMAILGVFDEQRLQLSLSEIAEALDLNTSTTHRLLKSLKAHGLVSQPHGEKTYAPGPAILRLARLATRSLDLQEIARPFIRRLRDRIGETVGLHALRSDMYRVVIDQAESRQALRRSYTELGDPIPLHQGAPGKAILAFLDEDQRASVLDRPLEAANENTITDLGVLRVEVADIRSRGYALSFAERVAGIHTVAVPIFDHTTGVVAALSVTGPAIRMPPERLHDIAPTARDSARDISAALGYDGPWEAP